MIPPHCYVCGHDGADVPGPVHEHFTLVYFGETDEAKTHDSGMMGRLCLAGHPRNAIWFCNDHLGLAREHESLETNAALAAIDSLAQQHRHLGNRSSGNEARRRS